MYMMYAFSSSPRWYISSALAKTFSDELQSLSTQQHKLYHMINNTISLSNYLQRCCLFFHFSTQRSHFLQLAHIVAPQWSNHFEKKRICGKTKTKYFMTDTIYICGSNSIELHLYKYKRVIHSFYYYSC